MKKVLIIISILLLTGCDIEYNLTINDKFVENIIIKEVADTDDDNEYKNVIESGVPLYEGASDDYYTIRENNSDNYSITSLKGIFNSTNYNSNAVFNACDYYTVSTKDNVVTLKAKDFDVFDNYYNMDSIKVNIKTDYKVIKHNADKVKDGIYSWDINSDNYTNKTILFKIRKARSAKDDNIIFVVIGVIIGLIILGYFGFKTIRKKNFESNQF